MKPVVYLVCGVPGSGKTFVCTQLKEKFNYMPHDMHFNEDMMHVVERYHSERPGVPVITECPFAERKARDVLEAAGFEVRPFFVIETREVVAERFAARENKPASQAALTRAGTIIERAKEWNAPYGKSEEVLELLKKEIF